MSNFFLRGTAAQLTDAKKTTYKDSIILLTDTKQFYHNGVYYGLSTTDKTALTNATNAITALKAISISAGSGLTGGGNLTANRTISHGAKPTSGTAATTSTYVKNFTVDSFGHVATVTGMASIPIDDLTYGTKTFAGSIPAYDMALSSTLGANRFAAAKVAGITVEYSSDGGKTWVDYGASDDQKRRLTIDGLAASFVIGKSTSAARNNVNGPGLRITFDTKTAGIYTELRKFIILVSTNGSSGSTVTLQKALQSTPDTFVDVVTNASISGWSGYNIINFPAFTTYGNQTASQYGKVRFIFSHTGNTNATTTNLGLTVMNIAGFGGVGWETPATLAKTGHVYSLGSDLSVTFPANITTSANVTAAKLIKSGGTSAQFLKADGSVDSNTYVTTNTAQTITGAKTFSESITISKDKHITVATGTKITLTTGAGIHGGTDQAAAADANIRIGSWYGIGFYPTISGQTITQGENAVYMNVRTGALTARGAITGKTVAISGGTASQFLKANGTVDSNTYITATKLTDGSVTKVGTASVGSTSKPIYLNAGVPTVISATVGAVNKPVYLNAGTITACSSTAGGVAKPVYMNAGAITACTSTVGGTSKPVYMNAGTITALSATVGSGSKPIYSNAGTLTAFTSTIGSANRPVYVNAGTITAGTYTFGNASGNAPVSNGTLNTNLNADMLDGIHATGLFSSFTNTSDDKLSITIGGTNKTLVPNSTGEWHYQKFTKSDNGGRAVYHLIADCTTWYNTSTGNSGQDAGIVGMMYGKRDGNMAGTCVQKITAYVAYNKTYYKVNTDETTYVSPKIVKYNDKYYIALYMTGSGRDHHFMGMKRNLLSTFIDVPVDASNNTPGLTVVFDTQTLNFNGNAKTASSAATLTTTRTINGTNFNGSANITTANWGTARNITIQDSTATNSGTTVSVNGSANVNLKLPATIKATLSGNATSATSANQLSKNTDMTYGKSCFQWFDLSGTAGAAPKVNDTPTTAWWHILRCNHANNDGYYTDLAIPFNADTIYYKRIAAGVVKNSKWVKVLDELNYSGVLDGRYYTETEVNTKITTVNNSIATKVNKAGDTMTGVLNINYIKEQTGGLGLLGYKQAITGVTATQQFVGATDVSIVIRSNNTNIQHYRIGVGASTVWDSGNHGAGSGLNADLLDGVHANGLFTALANSGNNISVTVGGTTKTLTPAYATSSGTANKLGGIAANLYKQVNGGTFISQYNKYDYIEFLRITIPSGVSALNYYLVLDFTRVETGSSQAGRAVLRIRRNPDNTASIIFYVNNTGLVALPMMKITSDDGIVYKVWMASIKASYDPYIWATISECAASYITYHQWQSNGVTGAEPTGTKYNSMVAQSGIANMANTATTATKLGTTSIGTSTQPIYLSAGKPAACLYTLSASVPAGAKFTDTTYSVFTQATDEAAGKQGLVPAVPRLTDDGRNNDRWLSEWGWSELPEAGPDTLGCIYVDDNQMTRNIAFESFSDKTAVTGSNDVNAKIVNIGLTTTISNSGVSIPVFGKHSTTSIMQAGLVPPTAMSSSTMGIKTLQASGWANIPEITTTTNMGLIKRTVYNQLIEYTDWDYNTETDFNLTYLQYMPDTYFTKSGGLHTLFTLCPMHKMYVYNSADISLAKMSVNQQALAAIKGKPGTKALIQLLYIYSTNFLNLFVSKGGWTSTDANNFWTTPGLTNIPYWYIKLNALKTTYFPSLTPVIADTLYNRYMSTPTLAVLTDIAKNSLKITPGMMRGIVDNLQQLGMAYFAIQAGAVPLI